MSLDTGLGIRGTSQLQLPGTESALLWFRFSDSSVERARFKENYIGGENNSN
jgi:hypothetical protein